MTIILRNGEYTLYKLDQKNNPIIIKNDVLETPNGIEDFIWSDQHEMLITVGGQCQGQDFLFCYKSIQLEISCILFLFFF